MGAAVLSCGRATAPARERPGTGHPPGAGNGYPSSLTNVNGTLYFQANDGNNSFELWKSDGSSAGTVLVRDILPGSSSAGLNYLTNVNGTLYFRADDGTNGYELWKSDGTSAGTVLVRDIRPGATGANPSSLTNVNGTLYFRPVMGPTVLSCGRATARARGRPGAGLDCRPDRLAAEFAHQRQWPLVFRRQ